MIDFKCPPLHPNNQELADFIDNKIIGTRKDEITEHLVYCDDCMDVVAEVINLQKNREDQQKLTSRTNSFSINNKGYVNDIDEPLVTSQNNVAKAGYANNLFKNDKVRAVVLSGLVASFALFFIIQSNKDKTGDIEYAHFKSIGAIDLKNIVIEDAIPKIKASMNLEYLESLDTFKRAKEYLLNKKYDHARDAYAISLHKIEKSNLDELEKKRQKIIVNYNIFLLNIEENNKESIEEYRNILKDNIRRLIIKESSQNK
jgi:hypothetical protein